MSKKVIVSGATGQDGSYMIEYLLKNTDFEVIGAIRRTSQFIDDNLKKVLLNPRFRVIHFDLNDPHSITSTIKNEKPEYFINFGAQTFVADSWTSPVNHFQINTMGLLHILEAIKSFSPMTRLYSAGSSEQWGNVEYSPQDINHPMKPRSPYGVSKCASQLLTKVYRESYGLYAIHGILLNHESPRRQDYFVTRKIAKGIARIKKAIDAGVCFEPVVLGNLGSQRDWSHAEDFVSGIWMMMNQEQYNSELSQTSEKWHKYCEKGKFIKGSMGLSTLSGEERSEYDKLLAFEYQKFLNKNIKEYVLSSGETHSIRDFIQLAFKVANIEVRDDNPEKLSPTSDRNGRQINYSLSDGRPLIVVSREFYRPAEVDLLLGDSTPAREELGWKPKHSFNDLVKEMVENDIANA